MPEFASSKTASAEFDLARSATAPRNAKGRSKVVIAHPYLQRGGSEAIVMWLIEALKRDHEVTVMTTGGWDLRALNAFYGTAVGNDEVKVRIAPVPWPARRWSAAALRGTCLQRFARQIAGEYDIRISAYNPLDWGLPAIHLIADFSWLRQIRDKYDPPSPGFIYRDSVLRKAYLQVAGAFERPSGRDTLHDDTVIANSRWTASILKQSCGIESAAVIYPPVWTEFPHVPWEQKEQAFVMIGRIAPEKRIEKAIAILDAVRKRGHKVRLHLCGQIGDDLYGKSIHRLCAQHADWIIPEGHVSGARKAQILANCRYGIQTRGAEPFGISVAEMVKAGAIVFAPVFGGQTEILDNDGLLFSSADGAVEKIIMVLSSSDRQKALRDHLKDRARLFNAETFMRDAHNCVEDFSLCEQSKSGFVPSRPS